MPMAVRCGIAPSDYWDLTLADINIVFEAENEKYKEKVRFNYDLAYMITAMIGSSFAGTPLPQITDIYPQLLVDEPKEEDDSNYYNFQKDLWLCFAEEHNKHRKEGIK